MALTSVDVLLWVLVVLQIGLGGLGVFYHRRAAMAERRILGKGD